LSDVEDRLPRTDEFLRQFLPHPQRKRVDEYFEEEIDRDEEVIADVERAAEGLMRDGSQCVGDGYDRFLDFDGQPYVPVILGIDALAIRPYSKQLGGDKKRFMFVFYIQHVDHRRPNIVLGRRTDKDGKARIWTDEMTLHLKKSCLESGFKVVAVSADGDPHYRKCVDPMQNRAHLPILNGAPFTDMAHNLPLDELFLTDFLHMMKYFRHRLATYLLALCPRRHMMSRHSLN
jgi:hypothetical protein